ncbi:HNH endonuclease [Phytobacter diazotrophicus]|uniref:HNH endonuclease n=1 Tax=Phytobacter diazotrophicus TaxID=395631 RepID=UPI002FF77823
MNEVTGTDAGLSGLEQIEIALKAILSAGGVLQMAGIYSAVNAVLNKQGVTLSFQGKSSLRFFINRVAVKKNLIEPYNKEKPGWYITEKGKMLVKGNKIEFGTALPTEEDSNELAEGKCQRVLVNKYERNATARKKCIAHYGAICQVCDLEFSKVYGDIGLGFIHVHHVIPLYEVKEEYIVDPIIDLIPLCPNCHSMIHSSEPMLSVEELRERVNTIKAFSDDL